MTGIEIATIAGTAVTLGDAMIAASTLIGAASFVQQGMASSQAGKTAAAISRAQAASMERQAGQERAVAQRRAAEQRRQGQLVSSRARTVSAAGGALDPTAVNILGDIDTETEIRALGQLYEGEERARGLEYRGQVARASGSAANSLYQSDATRSYFNAGGTLLERGVSLYDKYKSRPPKYDNWTKPGDKAWGYM